MAAKKPKNKPPKRKLKRGSKPKLKCDPGTLSLIRGFGRRALSIRRAASILDVSETTLTKFFKDNKSARDAYQSGLARGDLALLDKQYDLAIKGNVTMLIWLGKNRLDQKDRIEHASDPRHPLPPGGSGAHSNVTVTVVRPPPVPPDYAEVLADLKDLPK